MNKKSDHLEKLYLESEGVSNSRKKDWKNLYHESFLDIIDSFPDIIHSVDEAGVIVATNKKAEELLGYTRKELIGKKVFECYADEIQNEVQKGFSELKKEGKKLRVESKLKTKKGENIPVEIRSLSICDEKGQFVRSFSIIRDMRETIDLKSQIILQSKMAAIGELASSIIHDIRNPLSLILSYNSLIPEAVQKKDLEKIAKAQQIILKGAKKIELLTQQLSQFSRNDVDEPELYDLSQVMDDVLFMTESKITMSGVDVRNMVKGSSVQIFGRKNSVEQVFINMVQNACDALVSTKDAFIEISFKVHQDLVIVSIADNGKGIDEKHLPNIFDSFFTTKPKGQGTGLGLSICKRIIEKEGGKISVTSEKNKGTTFSVSLPKNSR